MTSRLAILGVAAALAGCDSARPENVGASVPGSEPSRPAATPDRVAAEEQVAGALLITLEDEGVRLVDPATSSARPLPFGTPAATAIGALGAAAGAPPVEQSVNSECGAGPILHARWANGLVALFQEDRFLGWDSREPGLATADGIGIGSTRTELEASRAVEVEETTLGVEFSAGGIGGLFDSTAPAAPITSLWAGLTCHFR